MTPIDIIVVNRQFCQQLGEPYGLDDPEKLKILWMKLTVTIN
ncbi:MAG: hypothetical protein WD717_08995 [Nitrosarchaeum sp.]